MDKPKYKDIHGIGKETEKKLHEALESGKIKHEEILEKNLEELRKYLKDSIGTLHKSVGGKELRELQLKSRNFLDDNKKSWEGINWKLLTDSEKSNKKLRKQLESFNRNGLAAIAKEVRDAKEFNNELKDLGLVLDDSTVHKLFEYFKKARESWKGITNVSGVTGDIKDALEHMHKDEAKELALESKNLAEFKRKLDENHDLIITKDEITKNLFNHLKEDASAAALGSLMKQLEKLEKENKSIRKQEEAKLKEAETSTEKELAEKEPSKEKTAEKELAEKKKEVPIEGEEKVAKGLEQDIEIIKAYTKEKKPRKILGALSSAGKRIGQTRAKRKEQKLKKAELKAKQKHWKASEKIEAQKVKRSHAIVNIILIILIIMGGGFYYSKNRVLQQQTEMFAAEADVSIFNNIRPFINLLKSNIFVAALLGDPTTIEEKVATKQYRGKYDINYDAEVTIEKIAPASSKFKPEEDVTIIGTIIAKNAMRDQVLTLNMTACTNPSIIPIELCGRDNSRICTCTPGDLSIPKNKKIRKTIECNCGNFKDEIGKKLGIPVKVGVGINYEFYVQGWKFIYVIDDFTVDTSKNNYDINELASRGITKTQDELKSVFSPSEGSATLGIEADFSYPNVIKAQTQEEIKNGEKYRMKIVIKPKITDKGDLRIKKLKAYLPASITVLTNDYFDSSLCTLEGSEKICPLEADKLDRTVFYLDYQVPEFEYLSGGRKTNEFKVDVIANYEYYTTEALVAQISTI